MCSDVCKCDKDTFANFKKANNDDAVRKFGRTYAYKTSAERSDASKNGIGAAMVQLVAAPSTSKTGYKNFMDCYNKVLKT